MTQSFKTTSYVRDIQSNAYIVFIIESQFDKN
jgi:hypothetical protein